MRLIYVQLTVYLIETCIILCIWKELKIIEGYTNKINNKR